MGKTIQNSKPKEKKKQPPLEEKKRVAGCLPQDNPVPLPEDESAL